MSVSARVDAGYGARRGGEYLIVHRVEQSSASGIHRGGSAVRQGLGDGLPRPTVSAVHIGASSPFLPHAEQPHEVRLAMSMVPSVPIASISNHSALL